MLRLPRTLRARLLGGLGSAVLAFLGAMAYAEVQLRRVGAGLRIVDASYLPLTQLTSRMSALEDPSRGIAPLLREGEARVRAAETLADGDEERAALSAIRSQLADVERAASSGTRAEVRQETGKLARLLQTRIAAVSERAAAAHDRAERASLALLAMGGVLGLGLLAALRNALLPVGRLTEAAQRVAEGEEAETLPVSGGEELATLAAAFNRMAQAVRERDRRLVAASVHVRRVLDGIGSAVAFVRPEGALLRIETSNPAARNLWQAEEGAALPPWLADLPVGSHAELPRQGRRWDVAVVPFDAGARLLVGEDVTERVEDRARLARSERLALVGRLLAQVTHEVRNPLNAMSLHAELLAEEPLEGEARAMLETITREIRRLEHVTSRYLDLARRGPPEPSVEDPLALARGVVALEQARLEREGVQVTVLGQAGACELDGDILRRALLNLVRNAAEAGARRITIELGETKGGIVVSVSDDGPGMDEDVQARAFEPFFTTRARGTGLGLAVVRQEIEDAGGSVELSSRRGAGTSFTLRLTTRSGV